MPDPISSNTTSNPSFQDCDPTMTCCDDPSAATAAGVTGGTSAPNVVTLPDVVITGDASRRLVEKYDQQATAACAVPRSAALAGCTSIGAAVLDHSVPTSLTSSLICSQLISAYDDCKLEALERFTLADRCEAAGGIPLASARPGEIVCDQR